MRNTVDLSGLRRIMGCGVDMGAYEWAFQDGLLIVVK